MATKIDWQQMLGDYKLSGQTVKAFCHRAKISTSGFYQAKRQFKSLASSKGSPPRFTAIEVSSLAPNEPRQATIIRITTPSGTIVEVPL